MTVDEQDHRNTKAYLSAFVNRAEDHEMIGSNISKTKKPTVGWKTFAMSFKNNEKGNLPSSLTLFKKLDRLSHLDPVSGEAANTERGTLGIFKNFFWKI